MRINPFPSHGQADPIDVLLFGCLPTLIIIAGIVALVLDFVSWLVGK